MRRRHAPRRHAGHQHARELRQPLHVAGIEGALGRLPGPHGRVLGGRVLGGGSERQGLQRGPPPRVNLLPWRNVDVMSTTQAPTPIIKASPALSTQTHALKGPSRRQAHDVETTAASQEVDHIEDPLAPRHAGELHVPRRSGDARPKQSPVVTSLDVADLHGFVPHRGRPADHPPQPWSTTRCAGFPGRPISYPHPSGRGGRSSPSCRSDRSRR